MTVQGIIKELYADLVEPRPFSRFTSILSEIEANNEWTSRALDWGMYHVDDHGNLIKEGK